MKTEGENWEGGDSKSSYEGEKGSGSPPQAKAKVSDERREKSDVAQQSGGETDRGSDQEDMS